MPDDSAAATVTRPVPAIALAFAGLYTAVALSVVVQPSAPAGLRAASLVLGATLVLLSAIDLTSYRLPDILTLPLIGVGLLFCYALEWDSVAMRALAAACAFLALYLIAAIYERLRGRAGLGMGDAKLLAASGAWLGLAGLPTVVLVASCTALASVLVQMLRGVTFKPSTRVPFGPFLAFGTWLVWLYGPIV